MQVFHVFYSAVAFCPVCFCELLSEAWNVALNYICGFSLSLLSQLFGSQVFLKRMNVDLSESI